MIRAFGYKAYFHSLDFCTSAPPSAEKFCAPKRSTHHTSDQGRTCAAVLDAYTGNI